MPCPVPETLCIIVGLVTPDVNPLGAWVTAAVAPSPRLSVIRCIPTHSLIRSLTHLFAQALWSVCLSLYEPWPGPPGHLRRWAGSRQEQGSLVQGEELAVETRGGWGSSERGSSASAWGARASFTEEMTSN